jgi:hypothetical protein
LEIQLPHGAKVCQLCTQSFVEQDVLGGEQNKKQVKNKKQVCEMLEVVIEHGAGTSAEATSATTDRSLDVAMNDGDRTRM